MVDGRTLALLAARALCSQDFSRSRWQASRRSSQRGFRPQPIHVQDPVQQFLKDFAGTVAAVATGRRCAIRFICWWRMSRPPCRRRSRTPGSAALPDSGRAGFRQDDRPARSCCSTGSTRYPVIGCAAAWRRSTTSGLAVATFRLWSPVEPRTMRNTYGGRYDSWAQCGSSRSPRPRSTRGWSRPARRCTACEQRCGTMSNCVRC